MMDHSPVRLSFCISTLNRAAYVGQTLDSILSQITPDCEIVVLDCASSDGTEGVLLDYARKFGCIRYIRQTENNGIDRDYDRTVELAAGQYCWLFPDDDLLKPGAVSTVLETLDHDPSLTLVNVEVRGHDLKNTIAERWAKVFATRIFSPSETDELFSNAGRLLEYIGCVVIKREIWLTRNRESYYGSCLIHVGVIFQNRLPGNAVLIAQPLISYRVGNQNTWLPRLFELGMRTWPDLIDSLPLSARSKAVFTSPTPWKEVWDLLEYRSIGLYSRQEYRTLIKPRLRSRWDAFVPYLISVLPGIAVNSFYVFYYLTIRRWSLSDLTRWTDSRFYVWKWSRVRSDRNSKRNLKMTPKTEKPEAHPP